MVERNVAVVLWVCAAALVVLFGLSMTGNGTWMGGIGMGWMMAIPLFLVAGALVFAYQYGRMSEKVDRLERDNKK